MRRSLEANLIMIFRLFVGLEMVILSFVPLAEYLLYQQISFMEDPFFSLLYQSAILFVYLSFNRFKYKLQRLYLPIAILIAVMIPSYINSRYVLGAISAGESISMTHEWALLPLLLIPLVPMAWQYDFKSTFILFGGLSVLEIFAVIIVNQGVNESILEYLYATFIRGISLLLVAFMISQMMHVQREQRNQLKTANLKLTRQALAIEEVAIIQERNRLARELHDTLAHTLSSLAVQLEAIKTVVDTDGEETIKPRLDDALMNTRSGLNETRRVLKALRATPLVELGLEQALYALVKGVQTVDGPSIALDLSRRIPILSKEMEQTIYRIVQESLKNSLKHAKATFIKVSLDYKDHVLLLLVDDDGVGFETKSSAKNSGYGINGLQERAEMMGGELKIESGKVQGTRIRFEVII